MSDSEVRENGTSTGTTTSTTADIGDPCHLDPPQDMGEMSTEAMDKTARLLGRGKYVAEKYIDGVTKAHDLLSSFEPNKFEGKPLLSLEILKNFKLNIQSVKKLEFDEETKKAFAYHIEVLKVAMPELFEESMETGTKEESGSELEKLFKKAPKVTLHRINEMFNAGPKIVKEKGNLLTALKELNAKMQIADSTLSNDLLKISSEEDRVSWKFLMENFEKITELFGSLGKTELIVLSACRDVGDTIFEKMGLVRQNMQAAATHVEKKSEHNSTIFCGPVVTASQYENTEELIKYSPESRSEAQRSVENMTKRVDGSEKSIVKMIKETLSDAEKESYDYILNKLPVILVKATNRSTLISEEKLYIGHHFNKVKSITSKMTTINYSKAVLDGTYVYKDAPTRFPERSGYRGSNYRGGRSRYRESSYRPYSRNR